MHTRFHYIINIIIVLAHVASLYVAYKIYMQNQTYLFERRSGKGWNYFIILLYVLVSCVHAGLYMRNAYMSLTKTKEQFERHIQRFRAFSISLFFISFVQYLGEIYIYLFKSTTLVEQTTAYWVMIQLLLSFVLVSFTLQLFIYDSDEIRVEKIHSSSYKQDTRILQKRTRTYSSNSDVSSDGTSE